MCHVCWEHDMKEKEIWVKISSTRFGFSVVRIPRVDDAFSGILELEASPVGGQQVEQRDKKRKNQRQKKLKKMKSPGHFLVQTILQLKMWVATVLVKTKNNVVTHVTMFSLGVLHNCS